MHMALDLLEEKRSSTFYSADFDANPELEKNLDNLIDTVSHTVMERSE